MRSRDGGFSLVELMLAVGIIGILAAIAVPKYNLLVAGSRQAEVFVNLSRAYTAERTFGADAGGYSLCLEQMGGLTHGADRYYFIGYVNVPGVNNCGPSSNYSCWARTFTDAPPGAILCSAAVATDAYGTPYTSAGVLNSAGATVSPGSFGSFFVTRDTFRILGAGVINHTSGIVDVWSIDQTKTPVQIQDGLY